MIGKEGSKNTVQKVRDFLLLEAKQKPRRKHRTVFVKKNWLFMSLLLNRRTIPFNTFRHIFGT